MGLRVVHSLFQALVNKIGIRFALFIPFAAFASGILIGLMLNLFPDRADVSLETQQVSQPKAKSWKDIFKDGFVHTPAHIAAPLLIGIGCAGLLSAFVDPHQFAALGSGWSAKWIVVAVAVPLYVCATASLPIAVSLLVAGLSPGTVFVFLMAGPATNAATFTTLSSLLGKKEAEKKTKTTSSS